MQAAYSRRFIMVSLAATAGIAWVVVGPATTVHAGARSVVALGDSYASGLGTRSYSDASGSCRRSPYAYPVLVARRLDADVTSAACAGATTREVRRDQLAALSAGTTDVTLTVGGNDAGFRSVIITCAAPRWLADCGAAIDSAQTEITTQLPRRLNRLYRAVRRRAPGARVVVTGYPRLFDGEDCNAGTWFSPVEERRLNGTADLLDAVTRRRARAHGFVFADPRAAFTGHEVCAEAEWVNGLSLPLSESYHPNRVGQRAYAALVGRRLN
jgi:lysophospholipase L1-like esterase